MGKDKKEKSEKKDKKSKKSKKPTVCYLPSVHYSKNFENLFENKSFSDLSFKFSNGNVLHAHKLIVTNISDYFKELYDNDKVHDATIHIEDDEKLFKVLVKFFLYWLCRLH